MTTFSQPHFHFNIIFYYNRCVYMYSFCFTHWWQLFWLESHIFLHYFNLISFFRRIPYLILRFQFLRVATRYVNSEAHQFQVKKILFLGISLFQVSHFLFQMPEIKPYMDYFPFPFYIILRDINSLPHVLCDALRQWFELVTAVDMWCKINVILCGALSSRHCF